MRTILFLCAGNTARSIMAEAYMNHAGKGRWRAVSAGSRPKRRVNPFSLETLSAYGITPGDPRSKSWEEFAAPGAPIDAVVTLCDAAAAEDCPAFAAPPGARQLRLHWSVADPGAAGPGETEQRAAFDAAFRAIRDKIDEFLSEQP